MQLYAYAVYKLCSLPFRYTITKVVIMSSALFNIPDISSEFTNNPKKLMKYFSEHGLRPPQVNGGRKN